MTDELSEALLQGLARLRDDTPSLTIPGIDDRTLCRASLLPRWTAALASKLYLRPRGDYPALVERLVQAGLVEVGITASDDGEPQEAFWVRARRRREVGDHLRQQLGARGLHAEYEEFHTLVDRSAPTDPEVRLWLTVRRFHEDSSGRSLMEAVEEQLARGDVASAAATVAAARIVADVVGGPLDSAVTRAQWRLDRDYRARDDLDHLRGYFHRENIESSLLRLVTGQGESWALHLRGEAGVGKTMVLRYLASGKFAEDHGLPVFPVARIDFDHLDPRYPEQRPVELLVALTDQLVGFASSRDTERYYRSVHDVAESLHEEFAKQTPDHDRTAELIDDAVARFVSLVEGIGAPVVLVLDTCEELAKLYAPGSSAPAIDRTFELLERLHTLAPGVRVVFAGRRELVPGSGKSASPDLKPRPYLAELTVSGFTEEEAVRFVEGREVPADLRPAVLERSTITVTPRRYYNPFDLESYSTWVRTDPDVDPEELLNAPGDPYIERRIIARMEPDSAAALPVAVAFGSFDRDLIGPAMRRMNLDPRSVFDTLAGQEWVRLRQGGHGDRPWIIEIDQHIRDRIRRALGEDGQADERALGRDAAELIRRHRLSDTTSEVVEAALRMLSLAEAADVWDELDRRILSARAWGWAMQVCARVAAGEAARGGKSDNLLGAVYATRASAQIHAHRIAAGSAHASVRGPMPGFGAKLEAMWQAVLTQAGCHPDPQRRRALTLRAICGSVAAGANPEKLDWADLVDQAMDSAFAGSIMAAAEAAVAAPDRPAGVEAVLGALGRSESPHIAAQALVLRSGLLLRQGNLAVAADLAEQAVVLTEGLPEGTGWHDWMPPQGLADRARWMRLAIAVRGGEEVSEARWQLWRAESLARSGELDADRLLAATIDYELCFRVPDSIPTLTFRTSDAPAIEWLHFGLSRPAVIAAADALEARGEVHHAASLLTNYRNRAVHEGGHPRALELCELALLRLCRRERTTRFAPVGRLAQEGTSRVRDEAWLVQRLVRGIEPDPRQLGTGYGQWRCAPDALPPPDDGSWQPTDHLDVWESSILRSEYEDLSAVPDANRAHAVAALLAGEVRHLAPRAGTRLLDLAETAFRACDDQRGAALVIKRREVVHDLPWGDTSFDPLARRSVAATLPDRLTAFSVYKSSLGVRFRDALRFMMRLVSTPGWAPGRPVLLAQLVGVVTVAVLRLVYPGMVPLSLVWLILGVVSLTWFGLQYLGDYLVDTIKIRRSPSASAELTNGSPFRLDQLDFRAPGQPTKGRRRSGLTMFGRYRLPNGRLALPLGRVDVTLSRPLSRRVPHIIALDVERELQQYPWEQWVGRGRPSRSARPVVVRLRRGERREVDPAAWAGWTGVFHGPAHLEPRQPPREIRGQRLLHIVGVPVPTSSGTFIRVHAARDTFEPSRRITHRESLLDLDSLTGPPTAILVLQAEPVDREPKPLDELRADFVRCALTAMDNGVDVVLIVPPVPDRLAHVVTDVLWRELVETAEPPDAGKILAVTAEVRRLVRGYGWREAEVSAVELDTILFHRAPHLPKEYDV